MQELPVWMEKVELLLTPGINLQPHRHGPVLRRLHKNLEDYQEKLIELLTTVRAMKVAVGARRDRLEREGH